MTTPVSVWKGTFRLFGVEVTCHQLDDGQRIIEEESMNRLLDALCTATLTPDDMLDAEAFAKWRAGEPHSQFFVSREENR